jgi:hypothetical protein
MSYPLTIRRCQHIKVNGIQCGSPALRNEMRCFFHHQCRRLGAIDIKFSDPGAVQLPTLEDANSIHLGLAEVMRLLVTQQIDHPTASLLLRALRIAAANVKFTTLEPKPTLIVIDPACVENRPLGATAWSTTEGREYDPMEEKTEAEKHQDQAGTGEAESHSAIHRLNREFESDGLANEIRHCEDAITRRIARATEDSAFQNRR